MKRWTIGGAATILIGLLVLAASPAFTSITTGEFHGWLAKTSAGAFTAEVLTIAEPVQSATALAATGASQEYRIRNVHISTDRAVAVTLRNDDGILWGPHTVPAGIGSLPMPDKGIRCGAGKTIYLTTGTFVGELDVFGVTADANTGKLWPLGY